MKNSCIPFHHAVPRSSRLSDPLRALCRLGALCLALPLATGCTLEAEGEDWLQEGVEDVAASEGALLGGFNSSSHPLNNDNVYLDNLFVDAGYCSGTLVAPDVILTAGHCVIGRLDGNGNPYPNSFFDGNWHSFPGGASVTVKFGPDSNNPIATRSAKFFNSPPLAANGGHDDIALLGLSEPVGASIAIPQDIAFTEPSTINTVWMYGYGVTKYRRYAKGINYQQTNTNYATFNLSTNAALQGGDSGGAILHSGSIIGVVQQGDTSFGGWVGGVQTFGTGSATKPNISAWLERNVSRTFCSRAGSNASTSDGGRHRMLHSWWSAARHDNFASSNPSWNGCDSGWDYEVGHQGYDFWRDEGWVASKYFAAPAGTVPLYLYWNGNSLDNATSTVAHAPAAGWWQGELLGYVWTTAAYGRLPLHLWYSASRQDYLTTTRAANYAPSGYTKLGIIGYVRNPAIAL